MEKMCDRKNVVGYWISEKKRQKFNWSEFENICFEEGLVLKTIDCNHDLEPQGPFDVILHKLTDVLSHADNGNSEAKEIESRLQEYINEHPEVVVIDPFENVRKLQRRHESYEIIRDGVDFENVFVPKFLDVSSGSVDEIKQLVKDHDMRYPCVCKPSIAHGSSEAHKMMLIFNEQGLKDCQLPCVVQEFVNHNAILYKVFIVDENFHVVERPSLKNFYQKDCATMGTIFFNSHDISRSGSQSKWSIISEEEVQLTVRPRHEILEKIARRMRQIFGLILLGFDVVVENHTGRYAIIDVNVFPGYDGYPRFFEHLTSAIKNIIAEKRSGLSADLDSGFESDEKKKRWIK